MANKPVVAIVGRPNVGKSTLFNRLSRQRAAIVSDVAGTTRDRVMIETVWGDYAFILVDTGGIELFPETDLWRQVKSQIDTAMLDADVIVFVVDSVTGITASDRDVADLLRRIDTPVILVANKADNDERTAASVEFYELALSDPIVISAYHNLGIDDLMTEVINNFPDEPEFPEPEADMRLAIIGRTNAGKSMLLNAITGQERAIVSDIPGTTRDSLDTLIQFENRSILLIDTAGIRRRGSIDPGIERFSVMRSMRAIDRADVAIMLMDLNELATSQDAHIVQYILEAYKGVVLAVNKWDLASGLSVTQEEAVRQVRNRFKFMDYAPVCFTSALNATGIDSLLATAIEVYSDWTKGVPRYDLRRTVMNAISDHPPSATGRGALKIYSVSQEDTGPPSFTFYVNRADMIHFSYQRYLENTLRDAYGFKGSPLRIRFRGRRDSVR